MSGFPWSCADCSFIADAWKEDPRPCPNCGSVYFRNADCLVRVKTTAFFRVITSAGPLSSAFRVGLTDGDQTFLRQMRIGWEKR